MSDDESAVQNRPIAPHLSDELLKRIIECSAQSIEKCQLSDLEIEELAALSSCDVDEIKALHDKRKEKYEGGYSFVRG